MTSPNPALVRDVEERRTFAIISHPDAGKTTLTEKLLLFGGAIQMAGAVKGRKASRHATSDWMEVEKQRGISVTSSVMQFHYRDHVINLLDTPGHEDFSEDTYRVLTAVDAAVMVIDAAKGVEAQTIKLLEVCRMRKTPIITFINKFDREVRDPLDLLGEIENVLKLQCVPITWPIGMGKTFRGVFSLLKNHLVRFTAGEDRLTEDRELIEGLDNPELDRLFPMEMPYVRESVELVQGATEPFDIEKFLAGEQSPVFFGSGVNNFGVQDVLDALVQWAPPPQPRDAGVRKIEPTEAPFSGFVFKIQANMNPAHRDRLAFIRICSGKFERNMSVWHERSGKIIKLAQPQQFLAQDRQIIDTAYPGDIVGLFDPGIFGIGDTICDESHKFKYADFPVFPPEKFARVQAKDTMKRKQFVKGIEQLTQEGAIQLFQQAGAGMESYIVGTVGTLQFEVLEYRLKNEYNVDITMNMQPYEVARWLAFKDGSEVTPASLKGADRGMFVYDRKGNPVLLVSNEWALGWIMDNNPDLILNHVPFDRKEA